MIGNPTEGLKQRQAGEFPARIDGRMIGNPTEGLKLFAEDEPAMVIVAE